MSLAVVLLTAIVIATIVGQVVVRRVLKVNTLAEHQGIVESMLGVVGTLFSVLLGLLVAGAIDRYNEVRQNVAQEANGLADVFRLARGLGEEDRVRIRGLCREYADVVLDNEWPLMHNGEMSPLAWDKYRHIWEAVVAIEPEEDRQNNIEQALLSSMQEFGENRRLRAVSCQQSLAPVVWLAIIFGAGITIGFTFLFTSTLGSLHTVMTALIAVSLGLNIWLLAEYSTPFSGELSIRPDMFKLLKNEIFLSPDTPSPFLHKKASAK